MCLSARRPNAQVQNRHHNWPCSASDEKWPLRIYHQHFCITLSTMLRFNSTGDMSYSALSETTLLGFITVAYKSEQKKKYLDGGRELRREAGKLFHFARGLKHLDEGKENKLRKYGLVPKG